MRPTAARRRAWIVLIVLVAVTFVATTAVACVIPLASRDDFNVVDWEFHHVTDKWLYLGGRLVNGHLSTQEEDARLTRYFDLTARITRLTPGAANDPAAARELRDVREQRDAIENDVEAIMAGRVTETLEHVGLTSSVPLFPDARWVFPPVAVEFDSPPNQLVVSPRDHIELIDDKPLRFDLSPAEIVSIEAKEEKNGSRSALVEPLAGVATYPSLVEPDTNYQSLAETVAHEWVHQYLFFHPLGFNYSASVERRTLNETVATLAGQELGFLVVLEHPLHPPYDHPVAPPRSQSVDVGATLQQLRTDVDALLAFGRIDAAEALMEQRQQELASRGVLYRRINQAFFAFRNVYASQPGSVDPIGPKITELRARAGSVG